MIAKRQTAAPLQRLYQEDETAWLEQTARLIRTRKYENLDYVHLAEFLTDMAKRDRREVQSRLVELMMHLLKWEHEPDRRSGGWTRSILHQRHELQDLLESKTLKAHARRILTKAYARAVAEAAAETGLDKKTFPAQCPYALDELLKDD